MLLDNNNRTKSPIDRKSSIKQYYQQNYCHTREFAANLYPLGCPETSAWPNYYERLFGVPGSKEKYRREVKEKRLNLLVGFIRKVLHRACPMG